MGELQSNTGEAPGRLTVSHLRLKGRRAGRVSLFRCHMRQAENVIELLTGFEEFSASYCSMVQNKHGMLLSTEKGGGRLIVQSCAFQSDVFNIVKDSPLALEAVRISSTRFIVPGAETPCIRIRAAKNVRVIGNFLHSGGIQLEDVQGGVIFGNHTTEPKEAIALINCSQFQCCNDYPTGGEDNYPKIYTVSGSSTDIRMARKEEIQ